MEALSKLLEIQKKIATASLKSARPVPELVAVSKTKPVSEMLKLYQEGQRIFGENYVQELIEKATEFNRLPEVRAEFHFIGHLQTNKVKAILPFVSTIHSVDSWKLFEEIEKRATSLQKKIDVYFQINIDEEASKGGFRPTELQTLSDAVFANSGSWIRPFGLMAIPDPGVHASRSFQEMQKLSSQFSRTLGCGLSMGMSEDFEVAITYGATSLRLGSALFGPRG
jgi:pyridoxal phosphate enzyme (YggS family)